MVRSKIYPLGGYWCGGQGPYLLNHVFNWADTLHTAKPTLDKCLEQIINLFECVSSQIWIFNCLFGWIFGGIYSPPGVWDPLSSWNTVLMEVIICKTLAHSETQLWKKKSFEKDLLVQELWPWPCSRQIAVAHAKYVSATVQGSGKHFVTLELKTE